MTCAARDCSRHLPPPTGTGRPREFCDTRCRAREHRARQADRLARVTAERDALRARAA
ncbi:hypothetical protein [Micromonospora tulbaghiae]|uniref:hypothetical protein n=1 Tax=Micromonospora tulbaghiae TaxID=479978 RepID=UPI003EBBA923